MLTFFQSLLFLVRAREKAEKIAQSTALKEEKLSLTRKINEVSTQQQKQKLQKVRETEAARKEAAKVEVRMRLEVERESREVRKKEKRESKWCSSLRRTGLGG